LDPLYQRCFEAPNTTFLSRPYFSGISETRRRSSPRHDPKRRLAKRTIPFRKARYLALPPNPDAVWRIAAKSFSPAGVTSPFLARAMPTHILASVSTSLRYKSLPPIACLNTWLTTATRFPVQISVMS